MDSSHISPREDFFNQEEIAFKKPERLWLHALLFIATCLTCVIAGTSWIGKDPLDVSNWQYGITYAVLIMTFLSAHEFGHYFAARYHKVDATLPFYIPMPIFFLAPFFGTLGAVIKTRSHIPNRKVLFDIGVAGPLAGFAVCLVILLIGFITLPGVEYLRAIHPGFPLPEPSPVPIPALFFGDTLLYHFLTIFKNPQGFLPPLSEVYHYPFLCVGWFGLFVTSLNLLPIGQLDGGHITYAMFGGKIQGIIARTAWILMVVIGFGFMYETLYNDLQVDRPQELYTFLQSIIFPVLAFLKKNVSWLFFGWSGWLLWAAITKFFVKLDHPPVDDDEPLDQKRMLIGWLAIVIFFLTFCYNGIYFLEQDSMPIQRNSPTQQV